MNTLSLIMTLILAIVGIALLYFWIKGDIKAKHWLKMSRQEREQQSRTKR